MPPAIPPGTVLDLDRAMDQRLSALIALLRSATDQVSATLLLMEDARDRRYLKARVREAQEILDGLIRLENGTASGAWVEWAREHIPATYGAGIQAAIADLAGQGLSIAAGERRIHMAAVEALLTRYVADATEIVVQLQGNAIRASRMILAQAGFTDTIAAGIVGGLPREATSRLLKAEMRRVIAESLPPGARWSPGLLTEVEIRGRRYQLDTWAEMHARTATAEAVTEGTMRTTVLAGVLHVQITSHAHAPCICTPFEGRIYRVFQDRGDMRFPHVSVLPGGRNATPLHPNCIHRMAPAVVEYLEERNDVRGRTKIPDGLQGMDERELARWVRQNRGRLERYSRQRSGILPEDFRVEVAA